MCEGLRIQRVGSNYNSGCSLLSKPASEKATFNCLKTKLDKERRQIDQSKLE